MNYLIIIGLQVYVFMGAGPEAASTIVGCTFASILIIWKGSYFDYQLLII